MNRLGMSSPSALRTHRSSSTVHLWQHERAVRSAYHNVRQAHCRQLFRADRHLRRLRRAAFADRGKVLLVNPEMPMPLIRWINDRSKRAALLAEAGMAPLAILALAAVIVHLRFFWDETEDIRNVGLVVAAIVALPSRSGAAESPTASRDRPSRSARRQIPARRPDARQLSCRRSASRHECPAPTRSRVS